MPKNLSIFLLIVCFLGLIEIFRKVKQGKMQFRHGLSWVVLDIILVLSIVFVDELRFLADLIGIEKISNMIFLFGFFVLLFISITLTSLVSEQKNKIVLLTQKLGILDNKVRRIENEQDNK